MSALAAPLISELFADLRRLGVVPVVVIEDAERAEGLAEALLEAGLPCAEITLRTPAALKALERMATRAPQLLLGAGTVLSVDQARAAASSGARFLVSPGLNPRVVAWALDRGIPMIPGVATATEVERGLELGLRTLKFFPAEACGGVPCLKALAGPYGHASFLPTGGIHEGNLAAYLRCPSVLACGGSWMVRSEWIEGGEFARIREASRQAVKLALEARP